MQRFCWKVAIANKDFVIDYGNYFHFEVQTAERQ